MRAASLSPKIKLMDRLSKEWMDSCELAIHGNMEYIATELLERRLKVYEELLRQETW